jgi:hypothetical protein
VRARSSADRHRGRRSPGSTASGSTGGSLRAMPAMDVKGIPEPVVTYAVEAYDDATSARHGDA